MKSHPGKTNSRTTFGVVNSPDQRKETLYSAAGPCKYSLRFCAIRSDTADSGRTAALRIHRLLARSHLKSVRHRLGGPVIGGDTAFAGLEADRGSRFGDGVGSRSRRGSRRGG